MKKMKFVKALISAILVLSMSAIFAGCQKNSSSTEQQTDKNLKPEDYKGTITVWASGEELTRFVDGFNKVYPNIKVNIEQTPSSDYQTKITATLSSKKNVPDIFTGEADYVKFLVDSGFWDDLGSSTYDVQKYLDDVWPYIQSVGTDKDGKLRALSWQAAAGTIFYRRDMAQDVLGTDNPEEVAKLLSSNDKMLDAAAKFKAKNIKMLASWQDIMNMEFSNRSKAWVTDNKLNIDDNLLAYMDLAKSVTENEYDLGVAPWEGEWFSAVESDNTFCYVLPSWGYQAIIKPQADKTKGKWGLARAEVPYVKGGCWVGIYKDSANKELAWKFLEYCCCNSESLKDYSKQYGEFVSVRSANEALAKEGGEEVLGGQNLYEFYVNEMSEIKNDLMTQYDGALNNAFLSATKLYANGTLSKEDAIKQFKEDVKTAYPELTVD